MTFTDNEKKKVKKKEKKRKRMADLIHVLPKLLLFFSWGRRRQDVVEKHLQEFGM